MQHKPVLRVVPVALAPTVLVGACGSSATTSSKSVKTTTTSVKPTNAKSGVGVDPNAPEVVAPGDIPDTQVFIPYSTADYTVTVPEGWSQSTAGNVTTYSDHYNAIRIETANAPTTPTVATVQSTEVPTLQRDVPNFQLGKVESVARTAGPAVLVTYRAGSTPDPVTGKRVALDVERYEFWRNGRQVTLVLSGARGSDNVDPWKTVTNSFGVGQMTPTLDARDLYRFYHAGGEETLALRGVSIVVEQGEVVAVTGPSGSGKSTLLACLAGLDDPDGGMVTIDGEPLSRRSEAERAAVRAERIGMLFQSANLVEHLTVIENVSLAQRIARGTSRPSAATMLDDLGIAERARAHPSELSGGELARAGLAVALANQPRVLLADEPTGELDHTNALRLIALLRERARAGAAVVVVTHAESVASEADRVVALQDGQVVS